MGDTPDPSVILQCDKNQVRKNNDEGLRNTEKYVEPWVDCQQQERGPPVKDDR